MERKYKTPLWKNILLVLLIILCLMYSIPFFLGRESVVQIAPRDSNYLLSDKDAGKVKYVLKQFNIKYSSLVFNKKKMLIRFGEDNKGKVEAADILGFIFRKKYFVIINSVPCSPKWLTHTQCIYPFS